MENSNYDPKYIDAVNLAFKLHDGQFRKKTNIPYFTHLMTVSSYVLEFGGNLDQAIAGLLHDAIEDQGDKITVSKIKELFGPKVAEIVDACTDADVIPKPPWEQRKKLYLEKLVNKSRDIKLVVACDKLHNAECIVRDVKIYGPKTWARFNASPDKILWYYKGIIHALNDLESPLILLLKEKVSEMEKLVTGTS